MHASPFTCPLNLPPLTNLSFPFPSSTPLDPWFTAVTSLHPLQARTESYKARKS